MKTISIQDLAAKLKNIEKDDLFIDVRTAEEFEKEHIPGFESRDLEDLKKWQDKMKGKNVYLSCVSGRRAKQVAEKLIEKGDTKDVFVCGGCLSEWKELGKTVQFQKVVTEEVTKVKNTFIKLSAERQLLVTLGFLCIFSLLFRDIGRLLILIIGLAFLFTGFSGKNILEDLFKKLPWNKDKK
ncbi:rhodanese-like domain-containing protein [Candidatus Gracilibacteria bacterium]|nr:rhodanese-like domain-containing protein [Candidatus Gracilibacteria bacterium]